MPRQDIDNFVQNRIVCQGMHIYRSTDFEGFGRAKGYGEEKANEKGWESRRKKDEEVIGNIDGAVDIKIVVAPVAETTE